MKTKHWLILISISFGLGFFAGRKTIKQVEKIEYIKGETIIADYPTHLLLPTRQIKGNLLDLPTYLFIRDTLFINRNDTVFKEIIQNIDTLALIDDYITERHYNLTLFDDKNGKLDINQIIQFNRVKSLNYTFIPLIKQTTVKQEKTVIPFVSGAYNNTIGFGVGGGIYFKDLGLNYMRFENNSNLFGLSYKF